MKFVYIALVLLLSACAAKQSSDVPNQSNAGNNTQSSNDITAPPVFERESNKSTDEQTQGESVSYQQWLRERQESVDEELQ